MKEFLQPLARWAKKEPIHKQETKKDDSDTEEEGPSKADQKAARKKPYAELYTDRHFKTHIGENKKAFLVFFTTGTYRSKDIPLFDKLTRR